ncbi:MAG: hypothetical protein HYX75_02090 [Acidobacteria bacterium]|nr:hypothetical protein [Acidobacteriota bacterium]
MISGDGSTIAFVSKATGLVWLNPQDTVQTQQIYVYNRQIGKIVSRASVNSYSEPAEISSLWTGEGVCASPALSRDGSILTYHARARNLSESYQRRLRDLNGNPEETADRRKEHVYWRRLSSDGRLHALKPGTGLAVRPMSVSDGSTWALAPERWQSGRDDWPQAVGTVLCDGLGSNCLEVTDPTTLPRLLDDNPFIGSETEGALSYDLIPFVSEVLFPLAENVGTRSVVVRVSIPVDALAFNIAEDGVEKAIVILRFTLIDTEGRRQLAFAEPFEYTLTAWELEGSAGTTYQREVEFDVPPGSYELEIMLEDTLTSRVGYAIRPLDVPGSGY